jgi:anti-sigma regulatory factor (Ser/Thr protein kinase)
MSSRLTVSNRQNNVKVLVDFVQQWGQERGLSSSRRDTLERAVCGIFQHLVSHAYEPEQPGSIAIVLEEKGSRLRLMFEDDAPPHNPTGFNSLQPGAPSLSSGPNLLSVRPLADSLIYYRTTDRKNRLVVFLTM